MKTEWIARLKALAQRNYSKGYGWQVLVECYDTTDWLNLVGCCDTWADALNLMIRTAEIQTDEPNHPPPRFPGASRPGSPRPGRYPGTPRTEPEPLNQ